MTLPWILCLLAVSIFLSCAGFLLERWARPRFLPTRTIWLLTLVGSLVLPATISRVPHRYVERHPYPSHERSFPAEWRCS
jgi:hypothetical protein